MAASTFVYVTYIRTSPDELWSALIGPQFTKKYWFGFHQESDWKAGSSWKLFSQMAGPLTPEKSWKSIRRGGSSSSGATSFGRK